MIPAFTADPSAPSDLFQAPQIDFGDANTGYKRPNGEVVSEEDAMSFEEESPTKKVAQRQHDHSMTGGSASSSSSSATVAKTTPAGGAGGRSSRR